MLKQIEGSRAMAEAIGLCRPEVICAYPITPQTHIVEGLGEMVRTGEHQELRIHQRRVRIRRAVGRHRRLGGRRARLYRDREPGPPVHGGGGLQRLGPRPADRDDARQPRHRRADQHLERSFRRHGGVRCRLDAAVRRDQPGGRRPAHPGLPPGRGTVDAGDGLRRRLHPHARRRARRHSRSGRRRRLSAALRAGAGARSERADLDRRHGGAGGLHRSALPAALQAATGAAPHSANTPPTSRRSSAATAAACCAPIAPTTPS